MHVYLRRINHADRAPDTARRVKVMSAPRQRFAHLSSTLRSFSMIACLSASVFSGIQAGVSSVDPAGSRRGERRMKAPKIQKGGNTRVKTKLESRPNSQDIAEILTETEFEEIHSQCNWLRSMQGIAWEVDIGLLSVWWWYFSICHAHSARVVATVACSREGVSEVFISRLAHHDSAR